MPEESAPWLLWPLLRAARASRVRRFVPSTFSLDMFTVPAPRIVTADMRRQFAERAELERGDVEIVHVMIGGFLDRGVLFGFIQVIDPETRTAYVWGDGEQRWTTRPTRTLPATPRPSRLTSSHCRARPATASRSRRWSARTRRHPATGFGSSVSGLWTTSTAASRTCRPAAPLIPLLTLTLCPGRSRPIRRPIAAVGPRPGSRPDLAPPRRHRTVRGWGDGRLRRRRCGTPCSTRRLRGRGCGASSPASCRWLSCRREHHHHRPRGAGPSGHRSLTRCRPLSDTAAIADSDE